MRAPLDLDPAGISAALAAAVRPRAGEASAVRRAGVVWLNVGRPVRPQGWKLHVSSRSDRVDDLVARVAPRLEGGTIAWKVAATTRSAELINGGDAGRSQVGKILTIYPSTDDEATRIGDDLVQALAGFHGPVVEGELRLGAEAPVYARYGSFLARLERSKLGLLVPVLEDGSGGTVTDERTSMHEALDVPIPFRDWISTSLEPLVDNRFLVVGELVRTRRATLVIAADLDAGGECVLKIVRKHAGIDRLGRDCAARLHDEWRLLERLCPTGVTPRPIAFLEDHDRAYLAMEHVEGQTLIRWLGRQRLEDPAAGAVPISGLLGALVQAVREVNSTGVVIRDLSPANVMVAPGRGVRILDLEAAGLLSDRDGAGLGTIGYSAPSVLRGEPPSVDEDLFSLAALTYYLATGSDLSVIPNYEQLLRQANTTEPWRELIASMLGAGASTADTTLAMVERRLMDRSISGAGSGALETDRIARQQAPDPADTSSPWTIPLLRELGLNIASSARWDLDAIGLWQSQHPSSPGQSHRDFYMGDAGIAYGLLRLGLATHDVGLVATAVDCGERLWSRAPEDGYVLPGLLIGEAGAGLLDLAIYEITGDTRWLNRAAEVSSRVAALDHDSPDLVHGTAGRGLLHAWTYEQTREHADRDAAVAALMHLERQAERAPAGPLWPIPGGYPGLEGNAYFGMAHGSAGVGLFLAECARVLDRGWQLLLDTADSLRAAGRYNPAIAGIDWPDAPDGMFRGGVWCHGSAGIAQMLFRAHRSTGEQRFLDAAAEALSSALAAAHQLGPTLCHGLAGLIEISLDASDATGDPAFRRSAEALGRRLVDGFAAGEPGGRMFTAERADVFTPEFMVGASGPSSTLARLVDGSGLGHFLSPPSEAFPRVTTPPAHV